MKILSVHNTSDLYGGSRCVERIFGRFVQEGHDVHVVLPEDGPVAGVLQMKGVYVHIHHGLSILERSQIGSLSQCCQFLLWYPISVFRLIRLMFRHKIDIVHTNSVVLPASGVAAFLARRPHVWHIREILDEFRRVWGPYQRLVGLLSRRVVAISACVRDQFDASTQGKIRIIYDGLDPSVAAPDPQETAAFRAQFPFDKLLVGVIGRIKWHRKGQEVLVHAADLLRDRYPGVHYVIVGSAAPGNELHETRLRELVRELRLDHQFTFFGETDSPLSVFAALDVAVVPSVQTEPFGCVVSEAMSVGTPVVGSRCGGIQEQIVDEESGLLFSPGDSQSLALSLSRLFDSPELRKSFANNGIARVQNTFCFEQTYQQTAALFQEVLPQHS